MKYFNKGIKKVDMLVNSKILEQKIDQYYNKIISKHDLGLWSMEAYYALMKGEYIEIEKLQIYHFLRKISTFHIKPNNLTDEYPCSDEEVLEIKEILCGRKDIYFTFNIKIFKNIYSSEIYKSKLDDFKRLKKVINEISMDYISQSQVKILTQYANRKLDGIKSLVELFEYHIKGIIAENIDFEEEVLDYRQSVGIYVGGSSINQINFIPNLNKLLECVMGDLFFRVSIVYKRGVPNLSLILL